MGQFIVSYIAPVIGFIVALMLAVTVYFGRKFNSLSAWQSSALSMIAMLLFCYFAASVYFGFTPNDTPPVYKQTSTSSAQLD